jgi:hypothetical protein
MVFKNGPNGIGSLAPLPERVTENFYILLCQKLCGARRPVNALPFPAF